jgi:5'-nucleotidase
MRAPGGRSVACSAAHAARIAPCLIRPGDAAEQSFVVHNINFPYPCTPASQRCAATVPAQSPASRGSSARRPTTAPTASSSSSATTPRPRAPMTDRAALDAGYISHTVLDFSKLGSI